MSKEFFEIMERIEKSAKDMKFLENMHPEISNAFLGSANNVLNEMCGLEDNLRSDLKKIHSKPMKKKTKRTK
jgi:hypothetical protein